MDKKEFWKLIDKYNESEDVLKHQLIARDLSKYTLEDMAVFHQIFSKTSQLLTENVNLWRLINKLLGYNLTDDRYEYFVAWIIGLGSKVYRDILDNYNNVSKYITRKDILAYNNESMIYIAFDAYEIATGRDSIHFMEECLI